MAKARYTVLLAIIVTFFTITASALSEVVVLKDGSKYIGKITYDGDKVKIATEDGEIIVKKDRIKTIYKDAQTVIKELNDVLTEAQKLTAGANKIEDRTERNAALDKAIEMLMKAQNVCMDVIDAFSGKDAEAIANEFKEINGTLKHARSLKVLDGKTPPPPDLPLPQAGPKEPPKEKDKPNDEKPQPQETDIESLEAAREFYGLGLAAFKSKQYDKARELFTKAISYNKDFAEAYSKLGDICAILKEEETGYGYYRQCIEIINALQSPLVASPTGINSANLSEEMIKLREDTLHKIEKFSLLEEKITGLNKEFILKLLDLGNQCISEEDYILSEEILFLAGQLDRTNEEAAGLLKMARAEINKDLPNKPAAENSELANLYYQSALELLKANKHEEAIEKFNKALSYRAEFPEALFNLGECYKKLGDNKNSIKNYRRCGRCLKQRFLAKEDEKLLAQVYQSLEKIDPNGKKFGFIKTNYIASSWALANDCANKKYNSFAWRILQYLLLVDPSNKSAQDLSAKLGTPRTAAEPTSEPGENDPAAKRAESYLRMTQTLFYNGEYNNLIATCNEVIKLNPKCALAYAWRGLAYWKKNDPAQMNADFEMAFKLDPDNRQLGEMKKNFEPLRKFNPDAKKSEVGQTQNLFNGKDINDWETKDTYPSEANVWGTEKFQNWFVKDGKIQADPRVSNSKAVLLWKGAVPAQYTLTVKFTIERNRSSKTDPVSFIYGSAGADYDKVSLSSTIGVAIIHKLELIRENDRYKAILDGKVIKDNITSSGSPAIGLMVQNGLVSFSAITLLTKE